MTVANLLPGEVLDLLSHDAYSTFIRGVQFEDSGLVKLRAIELKPRKRHGVLWQYVVPTSFARASIVLVLPVPGGP